MAALASLALHSLSSLGHLEQPLDVLVTDGHPASVFNNVVNCHLTSALLRGDAMLKPDSADLKRSKISCRRLLWDSSPAGLAAVQSVMGPAPFQLCLVSDCVHFQDFHAALLLTIGRLLSVSGVALLMQPPRADSLSNFLHFLQVLNGNDELGPLFAVQHQVDFDEYVTSAGIEEAAREAAEGRGVFQADIHLPQLVTLTLLRPLDEESDGQRARGWQKERDEERERKRKEAGDRRKTEADARGASGDTKEAEDKLGQKV